MAPPLPAWLTSCGGRPLGQRALGLVLIFATAVIWVAASFISAALVSTRPGASPVHAPPLLLTYLATSVFTLFLPLVHGRRFVARLLARRRGGADGGIGSAAQYSALRPAVVGADELAVLSSDDGGGSVGSGGSGGGGAGAFGAALDAAEAEAAAARRAAPAAAEREAALAAARCFPLWFGAQLAFNVSLSMTSVTSNTILSSASSLFTFALAMVFLREPFTAAKLLSIAACIGGARMTCVGDLGPGLLSSGCLFCLLGNTLLECPLRCHASCD